jgi:hypothetical protein
MNWSSGLKKPLFILIALLGAYLGINQEVMSDTEIDNIAGGLTSLVGIVSYLWENKRDSKARSEAQADTATREDLQATQEKLQEDLQSTQETLLANINEHLVASEKTSWDVYLFHSAVVLPAAEKQHEQYNKRFPWALQVFYTAQSKCARVFNDRKYWYLYSLALQGFRAVWGMTFEEAIDKVPEWSKSCQGSDVRSHALYLGTGYYAIYQDVMNYRNDYFRTSAEEFIPFDAEFQPEDYVIDAELVAHAQG